MYHTSRLFCGTEKARISRSISDERYCAHKTLGLLRERDRRIAFLEKRLIELEDAAANLRAITLRLSSASTSSYSLRNDPTDIINNGNVFLSAATSLNSAVCGEANNEESAASSLKDETKNYRIEESRLKDNGDQELKTQQISTIDIRSLNDTYQENKYSVSPDFVADLDEKISRERLPLQEADKSKDRKETIDPSEARNPSVEKDNDDEGARESSKVFNSETIIQLNNSSINIRDVFVDGNFEWHVPVKSVRKDEAAGKQQQQQQESNISLKLSYRVPETQKKRRNLRQKLRGCWTKTAQKWSANHLRSFDAASFGKIVPDDLQRQLESLWCSDGAGEVVGPGGQEDERSSSKAQEPRSIAETATQTSKRRDKTPMNSKRNEIRDIPHYCCSVETLSDEKKSLSFWSAEEDSLSSEGLKGNFDPGTEVCKDVSSRIRCESPNKFKYESIISELKTELNLTKVNLEKALKSKFAIEEYCKRIFQETMEKSYKEATILRICSLILEKFDPYRVKKKRQITGLRKNRQFKYHESSKKLYRQLLTTRKMLGKSKYKLKVVNEALKTKCQKYNTIKMYFTRLKHELRITSMNLNNIIAENGTLRQKIEETKVWLEEQIRKRKDEKWSRMQIRNSQENNELAKLRKKSQEDLSIIATLRDKLRLLESANANKDFLLNSYKSQLIELNKRERLSLTEMNQVIGETEMCRSASKINQ